MRRNLTTIGLLAAISVAGCQQNLPAPQRADGGSERAYEPGVGDKPLPPQAREGEEVPPPPFNDAPLVSQRMPEQHAFVDAYNRVGRPRVVVFVNRVPMSQGNYPANPDEINARSLDYGAVENILTDWLSCDGQVAVISPTVGHQMLNDQQSQALRTGQSSAGRDVAQQLEADVLVQVQAQPTYQTPSAAVRMVAEAIDLKHGGASLGRAVVDVPPPLEKTQINYYTRFLARRLMDGMRKSWSTYGAPPVMAPATQP
jgi:hypothetical protein